MWVLKETFWRSAINKGEMWAKVVLGLCHREIAWDQRTLFYCNLSMCLTQSKRAAKYQDFHQNFVSSGQSVSL